MGKKEEKGDSENGDENKKGERTECSVGEWV